MAPCHRNARSSRELRVLVDTNMGKSTDVDAFHKYLNHNKLAKVPVSVGRLRRAADRPCS